ncbi:hypothetical protein [Halovenus halobia]|uniref:hypothetical protein n=1 Tax=Halovenus halobia TaxID=3396622 RepID=UPI003F570BEE
MATSNAEFEVPTWIAAVIVSLVTAGALYTLVYGGDALPLGAIVFGTISTGIGLFTLYLFYRFVVAVEKIADKH